MLPRLLAAFPRVDEVTFDGLRRHIKKSWKTTLYWGCPIIDIEKIYILKLNLRYQFGLFQKVWLP